MLHICLQIKRLYNEIYKNYRHRVIILSFVGIGENGKVDRGELNAIASDPDSVYAHLLQYEHEVNTVADNILDLIC